MRCCWRPRWTHKAIGLTREVRFVYDPTLVRLLMPCLSHSLKRCGLGKCARSYCGLLMSHEWQHSAKIWSSREARLETVGQSQPQQNAHQSARKLISWIYLMSRSCFFLLALRGDGTWPRGVGAVSFHRLTDASNATTAASLFISTKCLLSTSMPGY